jgi:hypothetical protein
VANNIPKIRIALLTNAGIRERWTWPWIDDHYLSCGILEGMGRVEWETASVGFHADIGFTTFSDLSMADIP